MQGFRTAKEQHSLYLIGRTGNFSHIKKKRTVTNADSGQSPHEYGCASDWTLFDQDGLPTWPKADDPVWDEYILAVEKVGLKPGAEFGDIPHNELRIKASWRHDVYPYFKEHGVLLTESFIQSVMA